MNPKIIETNLFEICQRVADSANLHIGSICPFQYIAHPFSSWPNIIFMPNEAIITVDAIQALSEKIKTGECPKVLIINEHLVTNEVANDLKEFAFMPAAQWTGMVLEKANDIDYTNNVDQLEIKIVDINNEIELSEWLNIAAGCLFNNKSLYPEIFKKGIISNSFKLLIGYYKGVAVSTTLLFLGENAGIYMVATLPSFRRLGIGKVMMKCTQALAYSFNYDIVVLYATKEGLPLYKSIGYKAYDKITLFFYIK